MTLREVLAAVADGYAAARDAVMGFGTKILDTDVVSILKAIGKAIGWLFLGLVAFIALVKMGRCRVRPNMGEFISSISSCFDCLLC
jgi:hypothetical protein